MTNLNKKNAIYIEGVVIANGIPDGYGDILYKEDINKLMTNFMDKTVDTNHSLLEEHGISIIKNYTTEKVKRIHGREVPIGSWVSDLMVWNEDIIQDVYNHEFKGLSLASVPNKIEDIKAFFGEDAPNYRDFKDKDDLTPLTVSLVEDAGNGYEFDVYPYDVYIKRDMEKQKMTETEKTDMAELAKTMLSIIERSAKPAEPPMPKTSIEKQFNEINDKLGELDNTIDKKLDEKLEVFLSKLEKSTPKAPEPSDKDDKTDGKDDDKKGADKTPKGEPDDKDDGKDDDKKDGKKGEKEKPMIKRNAPQTNGIENHHAPETNPTFECEAPTTKRDMFGRPLRV